MIIAATVDGVLCQRDECGTRLFSPVKDKLLSMDAPIIFLNNGGNYAYRLFCEEQEMQGERPMVNPYNLPSSASAVREELEGIIGSVMGSPYPLLVSFAWFTEYRDGGIKMGGIIPPDERENPAWSPDWRLPRVGMLRKVCELYEAQKEDVILVTSIPDAIRAAREAGIEWLHPLEI